MLKAYRGKCLRTYIVKNALLQRLSREKFIIHGCYVSYTTTRCLISYANSSKNIFTGTKMAASLRGKLERELECSFCLERLKDPRVFPECHHTFCYHCILELSKGENEISCPECRTKVEVSHMIVHYVYNTLINQNFQRTFSACMWMPVLEKRFTSKICGSTRNCILTLLTITIIMNHKAY